MKILRTLITILSILTCVITSAQSVELQEKLHPVIYPFTINPKTANKDYNDEGKHTPLSEDYGYVLIPPSAYKQKEDRCGSLGIIVSHRPGENYGACELRCARCLFEFRNQTNKMRPMKSIDPGRELGFLECESCGAQMGSFVFVGSPCLDAYPNRGRRSICQEVYVVEKIEDEYDEIIELRITNPMPIIEMIERERGSGTNQKNPLDRKNEFR